MRLVDNVDLESGILGGIVIGLTTSSFLVLTGRLTGISGFVEDTVIFRLGQDQKWWTWAYCSGLIASGALFNHLNPGFFSTAASSELKPVFLIVAGLLTGYGTRQGCGCTSGHGISGLPRLSLRSLSAVLTFMATGSLAASVTRMEPWRQIFYRPIAAPSDETTALSLISPSLIAVAASCVVSLFRSQAGKRPANTANNQINLSNVLDVVASFSSAFVFGLGLCLSGMCSRDRVQRFLDFAGVEGWDPTLMGVMGGGVVFNLTTFYLLRKFHIHALISHKPINLNSSMKYGNVPENKNITSQLLVGSATFGLGWGLAGICPGPGLVSLGASVASAGLFVPAVLAGMVLQDLINRPSASPDKKL